MNPTISAPVSLALFFAAFIVGRLSHVNGIKIVRMKHFVFALFIAVPMIILVHFSSQITIWNQLSNPQPIDEIDVVTVRRDVLSIDSNSNLSTASLIGFLSAHPYTDDPAPDTKTNQSKSFGRRNYPWGHLYDARVWCSVLTVWPERRQNIEAIIRTWASLCDRIIFVVDNSTEPPSELIISTNRTKGNISPKQEEEEDSRTNKTIYEWEPAPDSYGGYEFLKLAVSTPQGEDYRNIWEKSWKMWQYVGSHHLDDAEWFLKIDDDTFFSPINFKGFARYYDPNKKWYLGSTLMHLWRDRNVVFNGGACYALSRGAVKAVVPIFESDSFLHRNQVHHKHGLCMNRKGAGEDVTMSVCLHSIGIDPVNTLDRDYRERFGLFQENTQFELSRFDEPDMWYWTLKPYEMRDGPNCCSPHMITFHGYKHQDADEFERLHLKYNIEEGVDGKSFEVPPPPQPFLHHELEFQVDEWRNSLESKAKDQLVYLGPGRERICWKCVSDH